MVITDGSTIIKKREATNMFSVKFDINITGDVIFFAEDKDIVKEYIDMKLRNLRIPLPFGGQDGSINIKVNSTNIKKIL